MQKLGFHTSPAWVTEDVEDGGGGSIEDDCDAPVFPEARDKDDEVRHGREEEDGGLGVERGWLTVQETRRNGDGQFSLRRAIEVACRHDLKGREREKEEEGLGFL